MSKPLRKPFGAKHLASGGAIPMTTPDRRLRGITSANKSIKFKLTKVEVKDPWGRK